MNTYYGNLIEGHATRPRDIERALAGDPEQDVTRRDLQLESAAHVRIQAEIDRLAAVGEIGEPASTATIRWIQREFYPELPEALLEVQGEGRSLVMRPGEWRSEPEHDVAIGRHVPRAGVRVTAFMEYFARRYRSIAWARRAASWLWRPRTTVATASTLLSTAMAA